MPDSTRSFHSTDLGDMREAVVAVEALRDSESITVSSLQARTSETGISFEVRYVETEGKVDEGEFRVFI